MTETQAENDHPPVTGGDTDRRCAFKFEDGRQCKARPLSDSEFCFFHDSREQVARKRLEGRTKGGKRKIWDGIGLNKQVDIRDFESLREFVNEVATAIMSGRMDAKIGNCLAGISGVLYRIIEAKEIEARLAKVERKINDMEKG